MKAFEQELAIAYEVAKASKDPTTQVGAIIIQDGDIVSMGYNRTLYEPDHTHADQCRATLHAEMDAIAKANRKGMSLKGATLVCSWTVFAECAKIIAASGITTVVTHKKAIRATPSRWKSNLRSTQKIFQEHKIQYLLYDGDIEGITLRFNGKKWNP